MKRFTFLVLLFLLAASYLQAQSIESEREAELQVRDREVMEQREVEMRAELEAEMRAEMEQRLAALQAQQGVATGVLSGDSLALVALYNATNGPGWTNNTNWLTGPVSTWFGIRVASDRVVGISLDVNKLTGPLPPALGNLANLRTLRLASNQLTGRIPPQLANLTNLFQLSLLNNQLTGSIPTELGNLARLDGLYLNENQLTGTIPASFGNLITLQQLLLDKNPLSGSLPQNLINLTRLNAFHIHDTSLCVPSDPVFQNWLRYIIGGRPNTTCPAPAFNITLKKVFRMTNGTKVAKIQWDPATVGKGKVDFYVDDAPDGTYLKRAYNTGVFKLRLKAAFPGDGPFAIQACAKNSTTTCSNILIADFSNALVDLTETGEEDEGGEEAGKDAAETPATFALMENYPNPFNPQTTIPFALPETTPVRIVVYDLLGRMVQVLVDETMPAGTHQVVFEAQNLTGGMYFYHMQAGAFEQTGRMMLVK